MRLRGWLSGQIRPGLRVAGLGLDVRSKTGTLAEDPSGQPVRSTGPLGLLPWARLYLRAWGSVGRYRAVGTRSLMGPIYHRQVMFNHMIFLDFPLLLLLGSE